MPKEKHGMKMSDPDRGPPMHEGAHHWDKGYMSDDEYATAEGYPEAHMRGNHYMKLQNEICHRDSKKLRGDKFTKIA